MNAQSAKIIFLEPFFSGSHRSLATGWRENSVHSIEILGLPGRFWKWRMRASAFEFARRVRELPYEPSLIFATSRMDLAHFRALYEGVRPPLVLYFHECQSSYPVGDGGKIRERDYQYLMTDLASASAADRIYFNSKYLKDAFFATMRDFLERMPDTRPLWLLESLEEKSGVLHQGIGLEELLRERSARRGPLSILWPHRWEFDKNPELFFEVLERLCARGLDFRLLVAGARYGRVPAVFERARITLHDRIDHWGEAKGREEWGNLLARADIVVSTARHETFGLAMIEAACAGAHPVAPAELSYPEVIPAKWHSSCLYKGSAQLEKMLAGLLTNESKLLDPLELQSVFIRYDWKNRIDDFDRLPGEISKFSKLC